MRSAFLVVLAGSGLFLAGGAWAQSGTVSVDAKSNIFGYGVGTPAPSGGGGGVVAPTISLTAGIGRTVTFLATGTAGWSGTLLNGPDGGTFASATNLNAFGPISGFTGPLSGMLVGVFVEAGDVSALSAPGAFDYSGVAPYGQASYAPSLRQVFFIGDGLTGTGTGSAQTFAVPDGASRLVLGVADGFGFANNPGWYDDNVGGFEVSYSAVPEPGTMLALAGGAAVLLRRRAKRA